MRAVICPVCIGSGIVDAGIYNRTSNQWTSGGGTEICRGCGGKGWVEVNEDYEINIFKKTADKVYDEMEKIKKRRGYQL